VVILKSGLPMIRLDSELTTAHRVPNNMITRFRSAQPLPILYHLFCVWGSAI
jgi:hypothetical protein